MSKPARRLIKPTKPDFKTFYLEHYLPEHHVPANIALHGLGTIAGIILLIAALFGVISLWWLLAFPIVHAAPGLLGHRLYERSEAVGDSRITRTDFPLYWFIIANHIIFWKRITGQRSVGE